MIIRGFFHSAKLLRGPATMAEQEDSYEVESVLDERCDELGEREYLIKWRGFSIKDATWEPRASLLPGELLRCYALVLTRL